MQPVLDASDCSDWIPAGSGDGSDGFHVLAKASAVHSVVLSLADHVICSELARASQMVALYVEDDEIGTKHVYCVVAEHEAAVYAAVVEAEERIARRLPGFPLHTHVRAHQGRPPSAAVPLTSSPIYLR